MFYISTELEKIGETFPKKILKSVNHPTILIDLENIMKIHFTPKDIFSATIHGQWFLEICAGIA